MSRQSQKGVWDGRKGTWEARLAGNVRKVLMLERNGGRHGKAIYRNSCAGDMIEG